MKFSCGHYVERSYIDAILDRTEHAMGTLVKIACPTCGQEDLFKRTK